MSFGTNIRRIRREADMTQEQLAGLLNISPQAVSRWETDAAMPDISLLPALANTFHVTTDALLGVDIENNQANIDEMCKNVINFKDGESLEDKIAAFREAVKNNPTSVKLKENYTLLLFLSRAGGIRKDNPDRADEIFALCEELVKEPKLEERGRDYYLELMSLVNVDGEPDKNEKIKSLVATQCSIKNCAEVILPRCVIGQERSRATAAATMTGILPPPPEMSRSMCHASRVSLLKRPSSSGTAAVRAAWKKLSSKCTWPASLCAVWRILPMPCGAARFLQPPSVS